jgi:hypothetical protein
MPEIYPKISRSTVERSARKTSDGKGRAPLPGVKTDAKHANATDKCGYEANRDLAKLIEKAMRSVKKGDKSGQHSSLAGGSTPTRAIRVGRARTCIHVDAAADVALNYLVK